jgi:hypothetical protein
MWWFLACLAIAVVAWILSRVFMYNRLLAAPHLMQFGQALPALKQAAMREVIGRDGWADPSPNDGRLLRTSAGLVFVYTVSVEPAGKYVHHASVSIPGRVTVRVVGDTFILLWAKLLGVGYERLTLQISHTTIHMPSSYWTKASSPISRSDPWKRPRSNR